MLFNFAFITRKTMWHFAAIAAGVSLRAAFHAYVNIHSHGSALSELHANCALPSFLSLSSSDVRHYAPSIAPSIKSQSTIDILTDAGNLIGF